MHSHTMILHIDTNEFCSVNWKDLIVPQKWVTASPIFDVGDRLLVLAVATSD